MRQHPTLSTIVALSSISFLAACRGQAEPQDPEAAARTPPAASDTAQIDAYVVAAFEDRAGNLWFGTNGQGVARWDGRTLRYFSIPEGLIDNVVTGIAEDGADNLWFGTQAGASRYDGTSFTNFGPAAGLPGAGCKVLVDRQGVLWAGTSAGAFRFANERFHAFALPIPELAQVSYKMVPGKVWDLFEDRRGNLWFGRDSYGACRYDGKGFTHFTKADGLCSNNVASIQEDSQGNLWFGSISSDLPQTIEEGGVSLYTGDSFTRFPELRGLVANDIYNIYADRQGHVWIGAVRVGAYRVGLSTRSGTKGPSFTLFDQTDRPDLTTHFGIQAFVQDRHGTLWFGFSGGLFRFDGSSFVNVTRGGPWASP
jgi:ligand-binding sensor domain-containing protein